MYHRRLTPVAKQSQDNSAIPLLNRSNSSIVFCIDTCTKNDIMIGLTLDSDNSSCGIGLSRSFSDKIDINYSI